MFPKDTNSIPLENLKQYIENFYGYGNLDSQNWFIGLEEGGKGTVDDLIKRISIWSSYSTTTVCLKEFHEKLGIDSRFKETPEIQPYWHKVIIILLLLENKDHDKENVRMYQRDFLGRVNSNHALLELGALPCKNLEGWEYSSIDYDILESKKKYLDFVVHKRIKKLQFLIDQHKPKNVFFMGNTAEYVGHWLQIKQTEYKETEDILYSKADGVNYYICKHPNRHGVTHDYFVNIGRHCKQHS